MTKNCRDNLTIDWVKELELVSGFLKKYEGVELTEEEVPVALMDWVLDMDQRGLSVVEDDEKTCFRAIWHLYRMHKEAV